MSQEKNPERPAAYEHSVNELVVDTLMQDDGSHELAGPEAYAPVLKRPVCLKCNKKVITAVNATNPKGRTYPPDEFQIGWYCGECMNFYVHKKGFEIEWLLFRAAEGGYPFLTMNFLHPDPPQEDEETDET